VPKTFANHRRNPGPENSPAKKGLLASKSQSVLRNAFWESEAQRVRGDNAPDSARMSDLLLGHRAASGAAVLVSWPAPEVSFRKPINIKGKATQS
jgi:hypothetical protein